MSIIKVKSRGTDNVSGRRNIAINGAMQVSQRGTVSSQSNDHYSAIDRFQIQVGSSGAVTSTQSTTVPTGEGFANSLKVDVVTNNGGSEDSGDYLLIMQKIEGLNLQQLKFGTSSAVPLACSFYVRSNLTGTFQFQIEVPDSGSYKYYNKTYTIDSANTWEKKTINIIANTNSSAIPNDNTEGLRIQWQLVGGSNYTSGTYTDGAWHGTGANRMSSSVNNTFSRSTDNEFLLTGVQLEVGDSASDFEHRSFGEELALCQRYFISQTVDFSFFPGRVISSNRIDTGIPFPVEMRATPSLANGFNTSLTNATCNTRDGNFTGITDSSFSTETAHGTKSIGGFRITSNVQPAQGCCTNQLEGKVEFSAEL